MRISSITLRLLLAGAFFGCCACSSSGKASVRERALSLPEKMDGAVCPSLSDLRGAGVGTNDADALARARADIASQIKSTVVSQNRSVKNQDVKAGGVESLSSSWTSDAVMSATLLNAQDARQVAVFRETSGQIGVVACMSHADAAKPFAAEEKLAADSLALAESEELAQDHPLRKNAAWKRAMNLYGRVSAARGILQGLGSWSASGADSLDVAYGRMAEDYNRFRSRYAFFWSVSPDSLTADVASAALSRISSRYRMETGECASGLRLTFESAAPVCADGGFGVTCSVNLQLTGSSCSGETYFRLRADNVRGTGRYDAAEARSRLMTQVAEGAFWNDWCAELDKWTLE